MKRGDLVTVAVRGDFGKPRPALVIQANAFNQDHASVILLPITSHVVDAPLFRMLLKPNAENGLQNESQVMIDKIMTVRKSKIGAVIGYVDGQTLLAINRSIVVFLGIA